MSLTSKIVLGGAGVFGIGTTVWVFYQQERDRKKMHEGVLRDMERQKYSKFEKSQNLDQVRYMKTTESVDDKVLRELVRADKT